MTERWTGLIFHGIGTPGRVLEPGEADYWISEAFLEDILDTVQALPAALRVHLSFDDGNASDHDIALPQLLARGMTADFFVLSGRLGQEGSLDAVKVRELQAAGMRIGSHGMYHQNWTRLSPEALNQELRASREALEAVCRTMIQTAGVPFGAYNARVLRALARNGYRAVYTSDGGTMRPDTFLRPRTSVRRDMTMKDVLDIFQDRKSWPARLRRGLGMARKRLL